MSMRLFLILTVLVLLAALACGQNSDKTELESLYISNQDSLEADLHRTTSDHYLFETLQRDSGISQITLELKKNTWRNPNDTRGLVDSIVAAVRRHVPLDSAMYSVAIECEATLIAQVKAVDTVVATNNFYKNARDSIRQNEARRSKIEKRSREQLDDALKGMRKLYDSTMDVTWYTPWIVEYEHGYFENSDPYLSIRKSDLNMRVKLKFKHESVRVAGSERVFFVADDKVFELEAGARDGDADYDDGSYWQAYELSMTPTLYQMVQAIIYSEHCFIRVETGQSQIETRIPWAIKDELEDVLDASRALGANIPRYTGYVSPACIKRKKAGEEVERIVQRMTEERNKDAWCTETYYLNDIADIDGDGFYEIALGLSICGSVGHISEIRQLRHGGLVEISGGGWYESQSIRFRNELAVVTGPEWLAGDAGCCASMNRKRLFRKSKDKLSLVSTTNYPTEYYAKQEVEPVSPSRRSESAAAAERQRFAKYFNEGMEGEALVTVRGDGYKIFNYSTPIMTQDYAHLLHVTSKEKLIELGFEWAEYTDGGDVNFAYNLKL